jgi:uncharacterized protein
MPGRHATAPRRAGHFDAFDLARRGASITGLIDAASLPRVADRLDPEGGDARIAWRIVGTVDGQGRPALEVGINGAVPLVCQRCLQSFSWTVAQRTLLLLARDEAELARIDAEDEHEVVLGGTPHDAVTLVEDELLLTLPFSPRCDQPECAEAVARVETEQPGTSPFGALAGFPRVSPRKAKG